MAGHDGYGQKVVVRIVTRVKVRVLQGWTCYFQICAGRKAPTTQYANISVPWKLMRCLPSSQMSKIDKYYVQHTYLLSADSTL